MAKKLKEFLKELAEKGKLYATPNAEFEAVAGASALDIDLPDSFIGGFESNFLTRERAMNDPSIVGEIQKNSNKNAFNSFDEKMLGFLQFIDAEEAEKIKGTKETYEKYDLLKTALKKAQTSEKGKVNQDANKILEEKTAEIITLKKQHDEEKKRITEEMNNLAANSVLKSRALAFNFAGPFLGLKESIADLTVNNIRQKYTVSLDKGQLKLLTPASEGGSLVEVFEGNEKLTVEKLLEKELKQFIAVSNGQPPPEQQKAPIPNGRTVNDMSLTELRQMKAEGVI